MVMESSTTRILLAGVADGTAGLNFDLVPARSRNGELGSKLRTGNGGEFDVALKLSGALHAEALERSYVTRAPWATSSG